MPGARAGRRRRPGGPSDLDAGLLRAAAAPGPACRAAGGLGAGRRGRRRPIPATSTPPPSSTRSTSAGCGAGRRERPSWRCATTTSTGPGCPATRPTPGWRRSSAAPWPEGGPARVFEDGGQTRDFVHVRDVARANVLALTADVASGAYNVASGTPHTVLDMAAGSHRRLRPRRPPPADHGRLAPGRRPPHRRLPPPGSRRTGLRSRDRLRSRHGRVRPCTPTGRRHRMTVVGDRRPAPAHPGGPGDDVRTRSRSRVGIARVGGDRCWPSSAPERSASLLSARIAGGGALLAEPLVAAGRDRRSGRRPGWWRWWRPSTSPGGRP